MKLKLEEKLEKIPVRCQSCVIYEADRTKSTKSTRVQKIQSSQKDNNIVPRSYESKMTETIGAQTKIRTEANSVNEAFDFVQDKANAASINIFHTGKVNIRKESVKIVTHRFLRLEAYKKLEHVKELKIAVNNNSLYKV